jgi:Fe-S oxidoreductase
LYPGVCQGVAEHRVNELLSTGAQKIVSSCPVCALMLKEGIRRTGATAEYIDIMKLFYEAAKGGLQRNNSSEG